MTHPYPGSLLEPSWSAMINQGWLNLPSLLKPTQSSSSPSAGREIEIPGYPPQPPEPYYEKVLHGFANAALNYYNSTHKDHFELVQPLYMCGIWWHMSGVHTHLSFIGRSKCSSSPKLKMFFAEVYIRDGERVKFCTIVEPGNPLFPLGCKLGTPTCHTAGVIYHPLNRRYYVAGITYNPLTSSYQRGGTWYYNCLQAGLLDTREKSAKKLLCEGYVFKKKIEELNAEEDKELRKTTCEYAEEALKWYMSTTPNHPDFEPLEPVTSVRFGDPAARFFEGRGKIWVHLNFMARDKDPSCSDASPELFFAEYCIDLNWITVCVNVTQDVSGFSNSRPETSCAVCRKVCPMFHPEGRYVAGLSGGTFGDALDVGRSYGTKVELLPKLSASTEGETGKGR